MTVRMYRKPGVDDHSMRVLTPRSEDGELLWKYMQQEMDACESAKDCEHLMMLNPIAGLPVIDFLHPAKESIIGISCRLCKDGSKITALLCQKSRDFEAAVIDLPAQNTKVYICPHSVVVIRPFEMDDIAGPVM
jgi:hypothetical protein